MKKCIFVLAALSLSFTLAGCSKNQESITDTHESAAAKKWEEQNRQDRDHALGKTGQDVGAQQNSTQPSDAAKQWEEQNRQDRNASLGTNH